jgi:hypothetical protein
MLLPFLNPGEPLLGDRFPLPLDRPFTLSAARKAGLTSYDLGWLCREGYLRRLLLGVYVAAQAPDSIELRAAALRLVVPADAVVTDRSAGWLHGAEMILAPNDHLAVPPVSVFVNRRGARLRNDITESGQRFLRRADVMEVHRLEVTTPLRTACDLGRLLTRDGAFAALDTMLRLGVFDRDALWDAAQRHRGMRGVCQLRAFVPLADPRSESPAESVTRLRWYDAGVLPRPELQIEVERPFASSYWIDLGVEALRFGVEYDGEEWHRRTPEQRERDQRRRAWLHDERGWLIAAVTKDNVFGPDRDIESIIANGIREARRRL